MKNDHELIWVIDRVRIELSYARASLRNFIEEDEPLTNELGALISRCNDATHEADILITRVRERVAPKPKLVET